MNLPDSERFPSSFFDSEDPLSPGACAPAAHEYVQMTFDASMVVNGFMRTCELWEGPDGKAVKGTYPPKRERDAIGFRDRVGSHG